MALPKLYTVEQIASLTHAPLKSVQYWIYSGKLDSVRAGRRRLVTEAALRSYLGLTSGGADVDLG
ncbi:MAG: helix-turn-helix domain-containing protein [Polyangiaceae bacterium]